MLLSSLYSDLQLPYQLRLWLYHIYHFILYLSLHISHIYFGLATLLSRKSYVFNQKPDLNIYPSDQTGQSLTLLIFELCCKLTRHLQDKLNLAKLVKVDVFSKRDFIISNSAYVK